MVKVLDKVISCCVMDLSPLKEELKLWTLLSWGVLLTLSSALRPRLALNSRHSHVLDF